MEGVGEPELIVDGAASPHTYSLRPSQAGNLENAEVVFWFGPQISSFLDRPLETLGSGAMVVNLSDAHDLTRLDQREGGTFEEHDHGDHAGHDDHDDHAKHDDHDDHADHDHDHDDHAEHDDHDDHAKHDDHDDHADHDHDHDDHAEHDDHDDHAKHADHDHDHDDHAEHDDHDDHAEHDDHDDHAGHHHGDGINYHFWLDPMNAKAMVHEIEEALVKADPENADRYEANAEALEQRLDELTTEVTATMEPVRGKSFVVFHDAYPYFENRFGVSAAGSITVSPEVAPGAARVAEIKDKVGDLGVTCVFSEPQFEPRLVSVITEGTPAKSGVLDPLGASIDNGPELYFALIRNLATSMRDCLSGDS
ncbi:MAG: zinc ABC transporter substrate-binding protein [Pseudomonadota bacterium]